MLLFNPDTNNVDQSPIDGVSNNVVLDFDVTR